jgi:hypothetical protein
MAMALSTDTTVDGRTLQDFLAVTREELAASMNSKTLVAAAKDDDRKFASWMTQTQWPQLSDQVAGHVCGFLKENLVGVFAGAWAKYSELKKCAKETRADPKSTMDVALADHDFTYEIAPDVDVMLNGVKVASIPFKIAVTCAVSGLELGLKQGCVYQVRSGKCDCNAEIRCAEKTVWTRALAGVNLPGELNLTKPIVLDAAAT